MIVISIKNWNFRIIAIDAVIAAIFFLQKIKCSFITKRPTSIHVTTIRTYLDYILCCTFQNQNGIDIH